VEECWKEGWIECYSVRMVEQELSTDMGRLCLLRIIALSLLFTLLFLFLSICIMNGVALLANSYH
jgi:hypothetical protein